MKMIALELYCQVVMDDDTEDSLEDISDSTECLEVSHDEAAALLDSLSDYDLAVLGMRHLLDETKTAKQPRYLVFKILPNS